MADKVQLAIAATAIVGAALLLVAAVRGERAEVLVPGMVAESMVSLLAMVRCAMGGRR